MKVENEDSRIEGIEDSRVAAGGATSNP